MAGDGLTTEVSDDGFLLCAGDGLETRVRLLTQVHAGPAIPISWNSPTMCAAGTPTACRRSGGRPGRS